MKRFQYTVHVTRFLVFSAVICLLGGIFTVKGLFGLYHRNHVKLTCPVDKIHTGDYVRFDISLDQVLGKYYEELVSGEEKYSPIRSVDAWTSDHRYVVASDASRDSYITLFMSDQERRSFEQFLDSMTGTYQIFGKVVRLKSRPPYDMIAECTGIDDQDKLGQMVSKKYEIKVVDPDSKESMWYKGLIVFALGLCGVWSGVEKKEKKGEE